MKKKICYTISFLLCVCLFAMAEDNSAIDNTTPHKKGKCKEKEKAKVVAKINTKETNKKEAVEETSDVSPIAHFFLRDI